MPQAGPLKSGDDVSALMSGQDVTDLMNAAQKPQPPSTGEGKPKSWFDAAVATLNAIPGVPHPEDLKKLAGWLPSIGGGIGQVIGGPGGAFIGGAAGKGLEQVAEHATELPGAVADVASNMMSQPAATLRGAAQGAGQGALQAAQSGLNQAAFAGVGEAAAPLMARASGAIMQSAIKPGLKATAKAFSRGVAPEDLPIVKTLLKEGVNVTPGGIEKLNRIISSSNTDIRAALEASPNARVFPEAVADRLEPVLKDAATQVNNEADVAAVKDAGAQWMRRQRGGIEGPAKPISLTEAQDLKTGTYKKLSEKAYGSLQPDAIEAQKALARGLKEDIAAEAAKSGVDITALNAREGAAITARDAVAKRLAQAGNRDPVSLAWLAHNPTAGILFIMERAPVVKSMLARGLYSEAARAGGVSVNTMRLLLSSLASMQEDGQ